MSTTLADLPGVGDFVNVTLDSRTEPLAAVINAVTGETVLLGDPIDRTGRPVLPEIGEGGLLVWGSGRNMRQAPIAVLETNRRPGPTWRVRLTAQATASQRRAFVRADVDLRVVVRHPNAILQVTAVDLSEGGMRCTSRSEPPFAPGDEVVAEFSIGQELTVPATVVRLRRADKPLPTELGLRFAGLPMAAADSIRRYVFSQLLEQRRRQSA